MSKYYIITLFTVLSLTINSCKRENLCDCVKGTGKRVTEHRDLLAFAAITMEGSADVYYSQSLDSTYEVIVEGGSHLIDLVKTEVVDGTLKITNDNKCNWMRSYKKSKIKLYIKSPHLKRIYNISVSDFYSENTITEDTIDYSVRSSGDVHLNVNCKSLVGHMQGSGDIYAIGIASKECDVHCTGSAFVDTEGVETPYTLVYYNSTGIAKVNSSSQLIALILSSGNVYYTGSPTTIDAKITGTGKLISL